MPTRAAGKQEVLDKGEDAARDGELRLMGSRGGRRARQESVGHGESAVSGQLWVGRGRGPW